MDITGVGNLSYLYNYGISDSDTRHVTGKENGIGSVDENGKQKECQTCKNPMPFSFSSLTALFLKLL